ncbi:MAG: tetratricopeptide repeat protein [Moraxellaceae bacterium]|nr:MAG: tetratricopeptide repeat protein [Moraxellaceae bacterium]
MILKKSFKNIYLIACIVTFTGCSMLGKNTNKNHVLKTECLTTIPMAVGEKDTNILTTSAQICKSPQQPELWQQLAEQFFALGKYDKAVQSANTLLKLQPDNAAAKDIILRSGLKITGRGLEQMKGSMQFLYGDTWSEASKVATQINHSRGEKPLEVMTAVPEAEPEKKNTKPMSRKKSYTRKTTHKKTVVKKAPAAKAKPASAPAKAQSSKPANPFSSFN